MKNVATKLTHSLISGLAGAAAVSFVRRRSDKLKALAPRVEGIGRRALKAGREQLGIDPPDAEKRKRAMALAGDIVLNSIYYGVFSFGKSKRAVLKGVAMGSVAGFASLMGRPRPAIDEKLESGAKSKAFGWYVVGGLAAAVTHRILDRKGKIR